MEDRVANIINSVLNASSIQEGFAAYLVQSKANQQMHRQSSADLLLKTWQSEIPQESHEAALRIYVKIALSQKNSRRAALLLDMLEEMVANNVASARLICEAVVSSEQLHPGSGAVWRLAFALMRRVIGGVDYKGCRDLLRGVLEKANLLPTSGPRASLDMLDSLYEVVSYIIDRNACLLPSYFAVNEIIKLFPEEKAATHWKLGDLLSSFVQSFRPAAQMVSISGRSHLLPVVCHSNAGSMWKLNPNTLRFPLSGPLPYDKELYEPQIGLLRYVLEQPYSRDMVCSILSLNKQVKQRCTVLEEQLVDLVVLAMQRSETGSDLDNEDGGTNQLLWQHLSSQVIFFVLFQFASFPHMVMALYDKLKGQQLRKGRDHLMWVLLQFISGSIQKNALEDFLPVMKLYDLLYPEKEALALPDVSRASCTHKMAVTCIWIHLNKKALSDNVKLQRPIPHALKSHLEFLKQCLGVKNIPMTNYKIALLCNAYSTNPEYFALPMGILVESIYGNNQKTIQLPGSITAHAPTEPLRMDMLDSLTVHAKMSLIHSIGTRIIKLASIKSQLALAPALVETYSRLLVYMEIESLGIKGFISQLLPSVFKSNAWGILHTLLEMFSYRLHHIQPHYRVQLLSHLHSLASVPQTNHAQLHLCVESTALRLIMGLGSQEVHPQLSRVYSEQNKTVLISNDSEELNRALVLTLARAMHVTGSETISGSWCKEILNAIMQATPHSWSAHTLACFPPFLAEFYQQNPVPKEDRATLRRNIDSEYRRWKSMASEVELINHFSDSAGQPLFLCVLWRTQLEDRRIAPTAYKVLERIGPRGLSVHMRTFVDYLVTEFSSNASGSQHLNQCVESLSDLIWKCNVVTVDRVILALSLHCLDGNDAHISCFVIQFLLLKSQEFRNRINDFTANNSPEHWKQSKWHDAHINFHSKFPEKFFYEGLQDVSSQQSQHQYLPIYFSNVCLRFIPVFDIVIHRFLELSSVTKYLEIILDHLGSIYKFHDRPVTYLYNTLHYYEKKLRDRATLKRKLVQAIIGSFSDIRSATWCLTEDYNNYLQSSPPQDTSDANQPTAAANAAAANAANAAVTWKPDRDYYIRLIGRLVNTIAGDSPFPTCDWRFNEFPNAASHALHACCVELMALPVSSADVGHALLDIVLKGASQIPREKIMSWMNAIGLVLTSLPDSYWTVIHEQVVEVMGSAGLQCPQPLGPAASSSPASSPFLVFNFSSAHSVMGETGSAYLLALCHAVWQHASIGQLSHLPGFIREKLKPMIRTEEQYLFLCHLVGPFLSRFHVERTKCLLDITKDLYEALENTDKAVDHMQYMDPITDFLYHIKYMFVGDGVKSEVEGVIKNLRPALKMRLRFISQSKEESTPT